MTNERRLVVTENLLTEVLRKKEFSFEGARRELPGLAKKAKASVDEVKFVFGLICNRLVTETFNIGSKDEEES